MTADDHDHAAHAHHEPEEGTDLATFWEERYAGSGPIWSGRVNTTLADVIAPLAPGRALDLGCGEGGDAIWLAHQGWEVTAVDVSATAVARAAGAAAAAGIEPTRITWVAHDLSDWRPDGGFDLVSASFFHSPVEFPRTQVLRRAAEHVTSGGHLLLVSHAAFPPWSDAAAHGDHVFLSPEEERAELDLDSSTWTTVLAEVRAREAVGPDGQHAILDDGVLLVRRA